MSLDPLRGSVELAPKHSPSPLRGMASPPPLLPFTSAGTPPTLVASGPAHSAEMVVAPTAPPEVSLTHSSSMGGTSNVGVPTLTTPTLTPTTLRNIEQMFAESDPHEPPHDHVHAAGFVPPIISPTSGPAYPTTTGLNLSTDKLMTKDESMDLDLPRPPPPMPVLFRVNGVGESLNLSRPKSLNLGPPPEHDSKPTDLSVPRPQSLNLFSSSSSRPKTLPLLMQRPNSLQFARRPVSLEVGGSDDGGNDEPLNLESPVKFKQLLVAASESQNQQPQARYNGTGQLDKLESPRNGLLTLLPPKPESLQLSYTNGSTPGLPAKNIEFLEKFLKAAAASSPMLNTPTSAMLLSPVKEMKYLGSTPTLLSPPQLYSTTELRALSINQSTAESSQHHLFRSTSPPGEKVSPPPYRNRTSSQTQDEGPSGVGEDGKKLLRRERNKQAAARCRKRRMDLTMTLQEEVSGWEEKVRGLKEELLDLEAQKKGLESVLSRHSGRCKVSKKS